MSEPHWKREQRRRREERNRPNTNPVPDDASDSIAEPPPPAAQRSSHVLVGLFVTAGIAAVAVVVFLGYLVVHAVNGFFSSDGPDYQTLTCRQWRALSTTDQLRVADDYLNSTSVDPKGGSSDVADFGDTISAACGPTRLDATKILTLRDQIELVFLQTHPDDAP